jgi:hypothetical protein
MLWTGWRALSGAECPKFVWSQNHQGSTMDSNQPSAPEVAQEPSNSLPRRSNAVANFGVGDSDTDPHAFRGGFALVIRPTEQPVSEFCSAARS